MTNIRSRKVLDSAKGQPCSIRLPGICNSNPETTVWAHLNGAAFGKGMSIKAHDVLGFHACSDCHSYYDTGHGTEAWLDDATLLECLLSAVCETWVRLIKAGIVFVPEDTHRDPKPKPRKPRDQRKPIPARKAEWPKREMHSRSTFQTSKGK